MSKEVSIAVFTVPESSTNSTHVHGYSQQLQNNKSPITRRSTRNRAQRQQEMPETNCVAMFFPSDYPSPGEADTTKQEHVDHLTVEKLSPTPGSPRIGELSPTPGSPRIRKLSPTPGSPRMGKLSPTPGSPRIGKVSPTPGSPRIGKLSPTPGSPRISGRDLPVIHPGVYVDGRMVDKYGDDSDSPLSPIAPDDLTESRAVGRGIPVDLNDVVPNPAYPGKPTGLVMPARLVNPVKESRNHKNMHHEMIDRYKKGELLLPKSELRQKLDDRRDRVAKQKLEQDRMAKRTSLDIALEKRADLLKKEKQPDHVVEETTQNELQKAIQRVKSSKRTGKNKTIAE